MLPIALGLGEDGRILQPLGIAVSGGMVTINFNGSTLDSSSAFSVFSAANLAGATGLQISAKQCPSSAPSATSHDPLVRLDDEVGTVLDQLGIDCP